MQIEYMVSRFPRTSETFIVRELETLDRMWEGNVGLRSLFPSGDRTVHDVAQRWVDRLVRPSGRSALVGIGWAIWRHPLALLGVVGRVVLALAPHPNHLVRSLFTVALACAHARSMAADPNEVHIHAHYATYPTLAAWVCKRLLGVQYSFTAHAHDIYVDQSMLRTKIADAQFVVTISEFNRRLLKEEGGGDTPIFVVHCGVDTSRYQFRERSIPAAGPVKVLCVASLQEYKGHRVLLEAVAAGGRGVDRIHLTLIGDGELKVKLRELASSLGIADRVEFCGSQTEEYVQAALDAADVFVLPSVVARDGQMEGLPVALIEALACGIPTVSTALSGIPEIIVDGKTGLLAAPGEASSLNTALESIISDPACVSGFASAGRALVEQEFELDSQVAILAGLFERLASGSDLSRSDDR